MIDAHLLKVREICTSRYMRLEPGLLVSWALTAAKGGLPNPLAAPFNVHAVGIARKRQNGHKTDTIAVQVAVLRKMKPAEVESNGGILIEREIEGVPIDVVETGPLVIEPQNDSSGDPQAVASLRPLRPGCAISHGNVVFGTLGAFCRSRRPGEGAQTFLLSCRHVLAGFSTVRLRKEIFQPGDAQAPETADRIAEGFARFVDTANPNATPPGYSADAAIAELDSAVGFSSDYLGVGASQGVLDLVNPVEDERTLLQDVKFMKFGRTTGLTVGTLDVVRRNLIAVLGGRERAFNDQFVVSRLPGSTTPMSDPGDSGAMVFHSDSKRAAGLVIGAPFGINNDVETVVSPLSSILAELDIDLV